MLNEITNAEFLRTDHGYFNRPIDHQSTTNDRLKPVLTTGLVNTHIDRSIANPDIMNLKIHLKVMVWITVISTVNMEDF